MFRPIFAAVALGIAAAIAVSPLSPAPARADVLGASGSWIVSLGDSYISGEGGRWAGNSNKSESLVDAGGSATYNDNADHSDETTKRCHRSTSAPVHLGGGLSSANFACSGATTNTVPKNSDGNFKPGLDFYSGPEGQGQALMLQNFAATHDVKTLAVSIGGNDFKFGDLVTECVTDWATSLVTPKYCYNSPAMTKAMDPANVAAVTAKIAGGLKAVRTAMRNAGYADTQWTLVVQNYASPLPSGAGFRYGQSGWTRQSTGGCGFWDKDADYANSTLLPTVNRAVSDAVAQSGLSNVRTLDVSNALAGRRLCEKGVDLVESADPSITSWKSAGAVDKTEWVTQIRTLSTAGSNYFVQESLHPNYWGELALRNCLRQAYNGGAPLSGSCTRGATGLTSAGEPAMVFTPSRG